MAQKTKVQTLWASFVPKPLAAHFEIPRGNMKKSVIILLAISLFCVFLMIGCGKDGKDGSAFVAIDWVYAPLNCYDNNPAIPSTFYRGQYYKTSPGTYNGSYTAWDGSYYSGTYTITINEGEDGGFFFWDEGDGGKDKYYTIWLYSFGPDIIVTEQMWTSELAAIKAAGLDQSASPNMVNKSEQVDGQFVNSNISSNEIFIIEKVQGHYKLRLEYVKVPN